MLNQYCHNTTFRYVGGALGIAVMGDNGLLFALALTVFVTSAINLFLLRQQIPVVGRRLA